MAVTVLIQADLLDCQGASVSQVVSAALENTGNGGLLQSPVSTHGDVCWSTAATMSAEATAVKAAAFLLVASGMIKVCVHQEIVSDI